MEDPLTEFISWMALICTVLQFLTGIQICLTIRTKGSTVDISAFPFIVGVVSCSLWLKYGILLNDRTLMTVNTIGLCLQITYTLYYYCNTVQKGMLHRQLMVAFGILFPILTYLKFWVPDLATMTSQAGLIACVAGVMFCASPLGGLAVVLKTKSTETLPFPLILSTLVVTVLWFLYGVLLHDYFIQIPNVLGACIAFLQLMLFVVFPSRKLESPKKLNISKM